MIHSGFPPSQMRNNNSNVSQRTSVTCMQHEWGQKFSLLRVSSFSKSNHDVTTVCARVGHSDIECCLDSCNIFGSPPTLVFGFDQHISTHIRTTVARNIHIDIVQHASRREFPRCHQWIWFPLCWNYLNQCSSCSMGRLNCE